MKYRNAVVRFGRKAAAVGTGLTLAGSAMAQTGPAQPDTTSVTAYLVAGAATILLIANAKYAAMGAKAVGNWVKSMIAR